MQTKHLCVLIHIWTKDEVGAVKLVKALLYFFYWPFQGGTSFVEHLFFCVLCFSCLLVCSLLPCGHLMGKGWPLCICWWCLLYFWCFSMWYPGSCVVLDCIVSWSLSSFLFWTSNPSILSQAIFHWATGLLPRPSVCYLWAFVIPFQ